MKTKKTITIGIDIDNTICDSYPAYLEKYNLKYQKEVQLSEVLDFYYLNDLTDKEGAEFGGLIDELVLSEEFQISLLPVGEAQKVIREWTDQGHLVHYVTARPVQMRKVTGQWLEKHGFWHKGTRLDLFDEKNGFKSDVDYKVSVAKKFGMSLFIEDAGQIAEAMKIPVFLFDRPWNQGKLPTNVERVKSWGQIREMLPVKIKASLNGRIP